MYNVLLTGRKFMNVLSLFDGISCGRIALDRLGVKPTHYFASEIDKNAIKCSKANWDDITHIGDVTKVRYENGVLYTESGEYEVKIDLVLAGSPCQGFSFAGKQLAFSDPRSSLYFEFERILCEIKQHNPSAKFLLENVKMKKESENVITERLGVNPTPINSKLVSAQNRPRYYWTNIPHTVPEDKGIMLKDILEDVGVSDKVLHFKPSVRGLVVEQYEDIKSSKSVIHQLKFEGRSGYQDKQIGITKSPCVTTTGFTLVLDASNNVRICTVTDLERLQTVPDGYTSMLPKTRACHALGNGWTVAVIEHILSHLFSDKESSSSP